MPDDFNTPEDDDSKYIDAVAPKPAKKQLQPHLDELTSFAKANNLSVGSTTTGRHNPGSLHYSGNAIDIKGSGAFDDETVNRLSDAAQAAGLRLRDERRRPAGQAVWGGPHVHVEWAGGSPQDLEDARYVDRVDGTEEDDSKYLSDAPANRPTQGVGMAPGTGMARKMAQRPRPKPQPAPPPIAPGLAGIPGMGAVHKIASPAVRQAAKPVRQYDVANVRDIVSQGRRAENALLYDTNSELARLTTDPEVLAAEAAQVRAPKGTVTKLWPDVQAKLDRARQLQAAKDGPMQGPNVYTDSGIPTALRAVLEPVAQGVSSWIGKGAGIARMAQATGLPGMPGGLPAAGRLADILDAKARELKTDIATADERQPIGPDVNVPYFGKTNPVQFAQQTAGGFLGGAPEMAVTALGVPGSAAFGTGAALEAFGENPNITQEELLARTAPQAVMGTAFDVAPNLPGLNKLSRPAQAAVKFGTVAAPTYAAEKYLGGATDQQALESSLIGGAFGALHTEPRAEQSTPELGRTAAAPIEPQVESAAKSAFERVGVSPEAREKATRVYKLAMPAESAAPAKVSGFVPSPSQAARQQAAPQLSRDEVIKGIQRQNTGQVATGMLEQLLPEGNYEMAEVPVADLTAPYGKPTKARVARYVEQAGTSEAPPLVINEKGEVIDGKHRFEAAKQSGAETVRVWRPIQAEGGLEPQQPAINVSEVESRLANRIREQGEVPTAEHTDEGMRRVLGSQGGSLQDLVDIGVINKHEGRYTFNDNIVNQATEKRVTAPKKKVVKAASPLIGKTVTAPNGEVGQIDFIENGRVGVRFPKRAVGVQIDTFKMGELKVGETGAIKGKPVKPGPPGVKTGAVEDLPEVTDAIRRDPEYLRTWVAISQDHPDWERPQIERWIQENRPDLFGDLGVQELGNVEQPRNTEAMGEASRRRGFERFMNETEYELAQKEGQPKYDAKELKQAVEHQAAIMTLREWSKTHPNEVYPEELLNNVRATRPDVQDLGDIDTDKWRGQEGFIGERRPVKPAPPGVKTGAVEDIEQAPDPRAVAQALRDAGFPPDEMSKATPEQIKQVLAGYARRKDGTLIPVTNEVLAEVTPKITNKAHLEALRRLNDRHNAGVREAAAQQVEAAKPAVKVKKATRTAFTKDREGNAIVPQKPRRPAEPKIGEGNVFSVGTGSTGSYTQHTTFEEARNEAKGWAADEGVKEPVNIWEFNPRTGEIEGDPLATFEPKGGEPHSSVTQARKPAGTFAEGHDYPAIKAELTTSARAIQDRAAELARHPGANFRKATPEQAQDYFNKLAEQVSVVAPHRISDVITAMEAYNAGDMVSAKVLAEKAFQDRTFISKLTGAAMSADLLAKGKAGDSNLLKRVLTDLRQRLKASHPGQEGFIGEKPSEKPGPEGIKTGAVEDREAAERKQKERRLPKTLAARGREPGTDLTYDELPNPETAATAKKRIADEGVEATHNWFLNAPPTAERSGVFKELGDRYLQASVDEKDPAKAKQYRDLAVEVASTEAPRATELGQTIQAYNMLDDFGPTRVLLEAEKLAEAARKGGKPDAEVPDEVVKKIAEQGVEFQKADEELKGVRKELEAAQKQPKGETTDQTGPRLRRVEELKDQQAQAIRRRRTARMKQVEVLAKMEQQHSNYYLRFNQLVRGSMVSAIPTAIRNLHSQMGRFNVERLTDVFAHTLRRYALGQESQLPNFWRDTKRQFEAQSRPLAHQIASEYPTELKRLFNNYALGSIDNAMGADGQFKKSTALGRGLEKMFGSAEKFVRVMNTANQMQEFHIRGAEFLAHLDLQVERTYGKSLEQFLRDKGPDKLPKEMISDAIDHALEVTFADLPAGDTQTGRAMRSAISLSNWIPPTVSLIPFGRWFYNSWKFLYQYNITGLADLARTPRQLRQARYALAAIERIPAAKTAAGEARRQAAIDNAQRRLTRAEEGARNEKARIVSKALIGTGMLAAAYGLRSSKYAGEKWYEVNVPGTERYVDARPFAPFSVYLFLAEGMRRKINHERDFSFNEFSQALGASTPATGGTEVLYDKYRKGDFDGLFRGLKSMGGDVAGALLTPVRQIKTLIGQFDKSEAITNETREAPFLGPIAESIPYASRAVGLKPANRPTSGEPIHEDYPAIKFFTGARVTAKKNFIEHELDRLRFDPSEVFTSSGVPAADSIESKYMGEFVARQAKTLERSTGYKKASDELKAVAYLQPLLAGARQYARAKLASERPDLYLELQRKKEPARMREFKKSLGISKAQELGVPTGGIPAKQPDESDVAYRARLLQLGRQRSTKLDEVAQSPDFGNLDKSSQRKALYNSVYS